MVALGVAVRWGQLRRKVVPTRGVCSDTTSCTWLVDERLTSGAVDSVDVGNVRPADKKAELCVFGVCCRVSWIERVYEIPFDPQRYKSVKQQKWRVISRSQSQIYSGRARPHTDRLHLAYLRSMDTGSLLQFDQPSWFCAQDR